MNGSSFGLYVHVPFCSRKCPYCDFTTYAVTRVPEREYVRAAVSELTYFARNSAFSGKRIHSVFFGGGTPSMLSPQALGEVIECAKQEFGIEPHAEITLEANPAAAQEQLYRGFKDAGFNRLSLGGQSFSQKILQFLGREHTAEQIIGAIQAAKIAGFRNVSVDLIFGVPEQTLTDLEEDINVISTLSIEHVSTYSLTIEKGTPFFQRQERGLLLMPDDELVAAMMECLADKLPQLGFDRYEISNYARKGAESIHNLSYWEGKSYLGIGAGAHSYYSSDSAVEESVRWSNCALPADYIDRAASGKAEAWKEVVTPLVKQYEFFFLGLRKVKGVDLSEFEKRFGSATLTSYLPLLEELVREGFLEKIDSIVRLSSKGILLTDSVLERLIDSPR